MAVYIPEASAPGGQGARSPENKCPVAPRLDRRSAQPPDHTRLHPGTPYKQTPGSWPATLSWALGAARQAGAPHHMAYGADASLAPGHPLHLVTKIPG